MTKSKIVLAFISLLLLLRIIGGQGLRVEEGMRLRLTIPTVDYPEYRDSTTVVRRGDWEARIKGYTEFMPGETVVVTGEYRQGRVIADLVEILPRERVTILDHGMIMMSEVRQWVIGRLQRLLVEPMASLAIGILLGVRRQMPADFYQALVATGTLHVVAASGYNVAVVVNLLVGLFTRVWRKEIAIAVALIGIGIYVLLAGGAPAIVRAGIMGSLTLIAFYWGRPTDARRLLAVTLYIMLIMKPSLIRDIGWQLSGSATLGILYLSPWFNKVGPKWVFLRDYLYPTLAATIATMPIIWWHFGRVSLIGVLVNLIILPVIPLIMLLTTITLILSPASYLLYVPLWFLVATIKWFG